MVAHRVHIDEDKLRELWADKSLTLMEIANYFQCSGSTITVRRRELGLPKREGGRKGVASDNREVAFAYSRKDGLTGGEWVRNDRGIMVWKSFT